MLLLLLMCSTIVGTEGAGRNSSQAEGAGRNSSEAAAKVIIIIKRKILTKKNSHSYSILNLLKRIF